MWVEKEIEQEEEEEEGRGGEGVPREQTTALHGGELR